MPTPATTILQGSPASVMLPSGATGGVSPQVQANDDAISANGKALDAAASDTNKTLAAISDKKATLDKSSNLDPPTLSASPEPHQTSPAEQWGSPAMWMATFGSLLTRKPLTTALNSATAVMNAYKEGDTARADSAYQTWKTANDNALKLHQFELDGYKDALSGLDSDRKSAIAQFTTLAHANQNQALQLHMQNGDLSAAQRHVDQMQTEQDKMAQGADKLTDLHNFSQGMTKRYQQLQADRQSGDQAKVAADMQDIQDFAKTNPSGKGGATAAAKAVPAPQAAFNAFMDEHKGDNGGQGPTADEIASFIQKTRAMPRSAPAMAMQKFMQENPEATSDDIASFGADYRARGAAVQAFATGKQGDIIRSFNTSDQHLDTLEQLGDALKNGNTQKFNSLANTLGRETGNPAPTNFETAKAIVANEITKAIIGVGGTGEDRQKAQAVFDSVNSPDQLKGAINTARELIKGQLVGLEKQYVDTTHKTEEDFRSRLSGPAAKALGVSDASAAPKSHPEAKQAPDGKYYIPDPARPGKFLRVDE